MPKLNRISSNKSSQSSGSILDNNFARVADVNPIIDYLNGNTNTTGNVNNVYSVKLTLSVAQIRGLDLTPITFIVAPGTGKYTKVLSVDGIIHYNSVPYSSSTLSIKTEGAPQSQGSLADLQETVSLLSSWSPYQPADFTLSQYIENKAVLIYSSGDPGQNGNSTVTLYATYIIVDL